MNDKNINIEKYDFVAFEKEQKPYLMVLTEVIQNFPVKHSSELLLWLFLESLPSSWIPSKSHLMKHFGISERTYQRYMSYLHASGLIEYRQERNEEGVFGECKLIVLNGTKFNPEPKKVIHKNEKNGTAKIGAPDESFADSVNTGLSQNQPHRQITAQRCRDDHINTESILIKERKKTDMSHLSVFSDSCSVKDHIEKIIGLRNVMVEEDVVMQGVFYAFQKNKDKSFDSVNKRVNIFLKKVREGQWLIPQGYKDITSQSIKAAEELQDKIRKAKYEEERSISQAITQCIFSGKGLEEFRSMVAKLKK